MATILESDLTRETKVKFDDREIQVTLTADQQIAFKLKGMKTGTLSIGIEDLYKQLKGGDSDEIVPAKKTTGSISIKRKDSLNDNSPVINLNTLRTHVLVTHMSLPAKLELEGILCELLKQTVKLK